MAFMRPVYTREDFHVGENKHGERIVAPADVYGTLQRFMDECDIAPDSAEVVSGKWWARLSAPGYMDATDWHGPFRSLPLAQRDIADTYDVDPDTGDDAGEGGEL